MRRFESGDSSRLRIRYSVALPFSFGDRRVRPWNSCCFCCGLCGTAFPRRCDGLGGPSRFARTVPLGPSPLGPSPFALAPISCHRNGNRLHALFRFSGLGPGGACPVSVVLLFDSPTSRSASGKTNAILELSRGSGAEVIPERPAGRRRFRHAQEINATVPRGRGLCGRCRVPMSALSRHANTASRQGA